MCTGKYCPKSTYLASLQCRCDDEGNIPGADRKTVIVFIARMCLKIYQRKTASFEFSRDTDMEELKLKNDITMQWLCFAVTQRHFAIVS